MSTTLTIKVPKVFKVAEKLGVVFPGFCAADYMRLAIDILGWECTVIDGVKGQAKSNLLLQRGYAVYQDWEVVLEYLVFEPWRFIDLIGQKGRVPWLAIDDVTVHLPSSLYFTDRELWAELSSNWASYRVKLSCFDCTAPRKDKVVGFILDDLTSDLTCYNRYEDLVSHYDFQRWMWLRDLKDPKKKIAKPIKVEDIAFPLTPGGLKISPELCKGRMVVGGEVIEKKDYYTFEKSGLVGVPRPIFKRYWKRRIELADKAAKRSKELFDKRNRRKNTFEMFVDEAKERKDELLNNEGRLDALKIKRMFGIATTKAYEIKKAAERDLRLAR